MLFLYHYQYILAQEHLESVNKKLENRNNFIEFAILSSIKVTLETKINSLKQISLN